MKNTTIPTKRSLIISENFDKAIEDELNRRRHGVSFLAGDTDALIRLKNLKIFQGESNDSGENLLLGELPIEFSKPSLSNKTSLEITFDIDANGILRVSVENRTTRERFERGIEALDPFARSAPARFTEVDLAASRAEADELLNLVDAAIKAHGGHIRREVLEYVEESRRGLKRAMQSRDAAELAGALASFSAATQMKASPKDRVPLPRPVVVKAAVSSSSVFISYARPDRAWLDRLRIHLKPLERGGKIEIWHDGKIEVGGLWELEIERALANASAAVLLISANFMGSTFIYENELPPILKRNAAAGLVIFPIFIGHCFYEHDPALSRLNAFNDPRRPLSAMTEAEAEAEFARFTGLLSKRLAGC
jgi:hypothetical protein